MPSDHSLLALFTLSALLGGRADADPTTASPAPGGLTVLAPGRDVFHEHYREDLRALGEALQRPDPVIGADERSLLTGHWHRLRGEFRSAERALAPLLSRGDAPLLLRAQAQFERDLTIAESLMTPWRSFNGSDADLRCGAPPLLQDLRLSGSFPPLPSPTTPGERGPLRALAQWRQQVLGVALKTDILSQPIADVQGMSATVSEALVGDLNDLLTDAAAAQLMAVEEQVALGLRLTRPAIGRSSQPDPEALVRRLLPPDAARREVCPPAAGAATPEAAALLEACAEIALFPSGSPEDLGFALRDTGSDDETVFAAASRHWRGAQRLAQRRARRDPRGRTWLRAAEPAASGRLRARIAYVQAADDLATWLTTALPPPAALAGIINSLRRAVQAAEGAADARLWRRAQALLALSQVLAGQQPAAQATLEPVLRVLRAEGDRGTGVGLGRLFAEVGAGQAFARFDPASAERLLEMAGLLLLHADAPIEASRLWRRLAALRVQSGASLPAETALRSGLRAVAVTCSGDAPAGALAMQTAFLYGELMTLHGAQNHLRAMEQDLAEATPLVQRWLGAGGALAEQVRAAQGEVSAAMQEQRRLLGAASPQDSPAERAARIERQKANLRRVLDAGDRQGRVFGVLYLVGVGSGQRLHMAQLQDQEEIVDRPDLTPPERYRRMAAVLASGDAGSPSVDPMASVNAALQRGIVLAAQGKTEEACALLLAAGSGPLPTGPKDAPPPIRAQVARSAALLRVSIAALLSKLDAHTEAAAVLATVERPLGGAPGQPWYLQTQAPWSHMTTYVRIRSAAGQHPEALRLARQMIALVEERRGGLADEQSRLSFAEGREVSEAYEVAVAAAAAARDAPATLEFMERAKARALQERLAGARALQPLRDLAQRLTLYQNLLAECQGQGEGGAPCTPLGTGLARVRAEYERERARAPLLGTVTPSLPTLAQLQAALPADAALLDFFLAGRTLVVLGLRPGAPPQLWSQRLPPDGSLVLRGRIDRSGDAAQDRALSEILLAPLGALLTQPVKRLVVVPHGPLHELSFASLPYDGAPLLKRLALHYLPYAGYLLRRSSPQGPSEVSPRASAAVILGYPGPDGDLDVGAEAKAVAAVYGAARCPESREAAPVYLAGRPCSDGEQPTPAALLRHLTADSAVVHVTAHGRSLPQRSDARLLLQGAGPDERSGDLSADDILAQEAVRARLVVLASCQLAQGRRSPSDARAGVPRALLAKGAGAVVANLFDLPDAAMPALLSDMHRALRAGRDPGQALVDAQRKAVDAGAPRAAWAGLVLLGGLP